MEAKEREVASVHGLGPLPPRGSQQEPSQTLARVQARSARSGQELGALLGSRSLLTVRGWTATPRRLRSILAF